MAKRQGCVGESTVDFRQLAKFPGMYWQKYTGLLPIGEISGDVLTKVQRSFGNRHKRILIQDTCTG